MNLKPHNLPFTAIFARTKETIPWFMADSYCDPLYTAKKENQIFLIYKEIQNGAVAKSYMTNGLLSTHMGKYLHTVHILGSPSSYMTLQLLHSEFLIYEENLIFFFISV
jgi:hypothetical protein